MKSINCNFCNKKINRKPSQIALARNHYCSNTCRYSSRKNGKDIKCSECGDIVYKTLKELNRSMSQKNFCSILCANRWRGKKFFRDKHPNWKNGESSYRDFAKKHLAIKYCNMCKTQDTRVLMVHHIDKNRKNNSILNLMILCYNCHFLVHHYPEVNILKK